MSIYEIIGSGAGAEKPTPHNIGILGELGNSFSLAALTEAIPLRATALDYLEYRMELVPAELPAVLAGLAELSSERYSELLESGEQILFYPTGQTFSQAVFVEKPVIEIGMAHIFYSRGSAVGLVDPVYAQGLDGASKSSELLRKYQRLQDVAQQSLQALPTSQLASTVRYAGGDRPRILCAANYAPAIQRQDFLELSADLARALLAVPVLAEPKPGARQELAANWYKETSYLHHQWRVLMDKRRRGSWGEHLQQDDIFSWQLRQKVATQSLPSPQLLAEPRFQEELATLVLHLNFEPDPRKVAPHLQSFQWPTIQRPPLYQAMESMIRHNLPVGRPLLA